MSRQVVAVVLLGFIMCMTVASGMYFHANPALFTPAVGFGCILSAFIAGYVLGAVARLPTIPWYLGTAVMSALGLMALGWGVSLVPDVPPPYYSRLPYEALGLITIAFLLLAATAYRLYTPVPERGNYTTDY